MWYLHIFFLYIFFNVQFLPPSIAQLGDPMRSSLFDAIINGIQCGCDRRDDLNVSKVIIRVHNYETGASAAYPIDNAAEAILNSTDFDPTQCIQMFVNGFKNASVNDGNCALSKIRCNLTSPLVLTVDHTEYTDDNNNILLKLNTIQLYKRAVYYTKSIGYQLGKFVVKILARVNRDNIDMFGHSLGAQMLGYIGSVVINDTGVPLNELYATDAAGPCFDDCPKENIRSGHANTVISFHCNSGRYGTNLTVSDYDFFSNDGVHQANCSYGNIDPVSNYLESLCSHLKCVPILTNTAFNEGWNAVKCPTSNAYLNGSCDDNESTLAAYRQVPSSSRGVYYFTPSNELLCDEPFLQKQLESNF